MWRYRWAMSDDGDLIVIQLVVDSHSCPTLDLLAEHTCCRAALDHLHAVVGKCNPCRRLVCRLPDVGSPATTVSWCALLCRPTGPTVVHTDAVGTVVAANSMPLVAATFSVVSRDGNALSANRIHVSDGHSVVSRCAFWRSGGGGADTASTRTGGAT